MTTIPQSIVMGIFRDRMLAEQAIDELRQTDWGADDVQLLGKSSGGVFGALKNALSPRDAADELAQVDLPEEQAQLCQRELDSGSFIVLAHLKSHSLEARDILNRYGAYHVFTPFPLGGEQVIQVRQEVAQLQKQVVDIGEIRIHKRVITEDKTFTVPVTREEVTVERVPLQSVSQPPSPVQANVEGSNNGPHSLYDASTTLSTSEEEQLREAGTLRILVREEQVVIQKQTVVIEEIVVQKQLIQETASLVEPIKHEEVYVERVGKVTVHEDSVDVRS